MQNARRTVDNLLRNKKCKRMAFYDLIWEDTLRKWTQQGYPADEKGNAVDQGIHFNYDMYCCGGWFDILPLRGHTEIVEESDQWIIKRNGAGAALRFWKNKSGTPEHIDFRMTSRKIWEQDYRPHLIDLDRQRVDIQTTKDTLAKRKKEGYWTFYGNIFIFENMRQSMGDLCLYESVLADPAWIHDYNRIYTDFFKKHFKLLFDEAGIPDGIWLYEDLGYKGSLFCSPKANEELFFPYYRELLEFFHSYDLPVVLHSCGYIEQALDLIVDVGFDGLNPMEVKAGCDPLRFAKKYKDKLVFVGGFDERILESGDRSAIKKGILDLVEGMKKLGARYVFASDHSISTSVNYNDFLYAIEVFRENMYY